jgi:hypothetical protein
MSKVHRAYRHSWWRRSKELTDRDWLAMCNFADNGVSYKTLAAHFRCKLALIEGELVETDKYGYKSRHLLSKKKSGELGRSTPGLTWWESDHSDPLELVKLYYPQYAQSAEISAKAAQRTLSFDVEAYLDKTFGPGYVTNENAKIIEGHVEKLVVAYKEANVLATAEMVKSVLDSMYVSSAL